MRRLVYILLFAVVVMASCTVETSGNGDLDGFWHLERVDTLSTGGVCGHSQERIFWSVQYHLLQLNVDSATYLMRFEQTSDSLYIHTPYRTNGGQGEDYPVTDYSLLKKFGIEDSVVHYQKESLSSDRMTLKSPKLRLYFKKF